jgi:hypothetical protein
MKITEREYNYIYEICLRIGIVKDNRRKIERFMLRPDSSFWKHPTENYVVRVGKNGRAGITHLKYCLKVMNAGLELR